MHHLDLYEGQHVYVFFSYISHVEIPTFQRLETGEDLATEFDIPHFDGEADDIVLEKTVMAGENALGIQLGYWLEEEPTMILHTCIGVNANDGASVANFRYFNDWR